MGVRARGQRQSLAPHPVGVRGECMRLNDL
jgi:hypothetical protein